MRKAAPQPPRRLRTTTALLSPALLALGLALAGPLAAPAGAAHPFYEEQLRRGRAALDRGEHAEAERALRLAAFGLLDEPSALAGCLVHLALARHALGDADGVREAVERVLALEERFGAYRAASLPSPVAASFAAVALGAVPAGRLAELEAFAEPARRAIEEELEALDAGPRGERLEALLAGEPEEPRWALLLGRLELADGRFQRAAELAGRVVAADPDSQAGLCLRGLARAGASDCAGAAGDLAACEQARTDEAVAVTHLSCLDELERWREAVAFAATLSPRLRASRRIARLERRAERKAPRTPAATLPAAGDTATEGTPGDQEPAGATAPDDDPPDRTAGGGDGAPAPNSNADSAETTADAASDATRAETSPGSAPGTGRAETPSDSNADSGAGIAPGAGVPSSVPPAPPASPPLPAEDAARLERAHTLLAAARTAGELDEAWVLAREVADRNPGSRPAQHLAAEIAYLSSRWAEAASYFRRGGEPARPEQLFYLAVALYESGAPEEAAEALEKALPRLRRTPFVDGYVDRIIGP